MSNQDNIIPDDEFAQNPQPTSSQLSGVITELADGFDPKIHINEKNSLCLVWDNVVPFPYLGYPMVLTPQDYEIARRAERNREAIIVTNWREPEDENESGRALNEYGVIAQIVKTIEKAVESL